jgi:hypothetical protein
MPMEKNYHLKTKPRVAAVALQCPHIKEECSMQFIVRVPISSAINNNMFCCYYYVQHVMRIKCTLNSQHLVYVSFGRPLYLPDIIRERFLQSPCL